MKKLYLSAVLSFALVGMVATGAKYSAKGTAKASVATAKATGKAAKATGRAMFWFAKNV
jgi:hypothetical protein